MTTEREKQVFHEADAGNEKLVDAYGFHPYTLWDNGYETWIITGLTQLYSYVLLDEVSWH